MGSMAVGSPLTIFRKPGPIKKHVSRFLMLAHSHISIKNTPLLQIRSTFKNKVFEDESKGIVCYLDDNGEITCEGYDEGPRLHPQFTRLTFNQRDAEIIDLLQRSWLQIVDGGELDHADKDVTEAKDLDSTHSANQC